MSGRLRILDWMRFRSRVFENSLRAFYGVAVVSMPDSFRDLCESLTFKSVIMTHIFLAKLVSGKVDGTVGTAADFLADDILIDAVLSAVCLMGCVLRPGI